MPITSGAPLNAANLPYRDSLTAFTAGGVDGTNKLWMSMWGGEVITTYDKYRSFELLVDHRVADAPVLEFPITGTVSGKASWNSGEELIGSTSDSASKTIAIRIDERPIVAFTEVDQIDLRNTQWDFAQELARQCAEWIANVRDVQLGMYIIRAGLEPNVGSDPRGLVFPDPYVNAALEHAGRRGSTADQRTNAALAILTACEEYVVELQEKHISMDETIYCAVSPQTFQDIRSLGVARDATALAGGAGRPLFGGVAEAGSLGVDLKVGLHKLSDVLEYQGVYIVKTNHLLPTSGAFKRDNTVDSPYGQARYNLKLDTADIEGFIWQPSAVCGLRMDGVQTFSMYDGRRNTTFMRVHLHAGTGVKRPEFVKILSSDTGLNTRLLMRGAVTGYSAEFVNVSGTAFPFA
jgi:hypothetical protein